MKRIALGLFSRLALVWLAAAVPALAAPPAARAAGTVRVALGPSVTTAMIAQYLEESGIWKAWGSRAGIDFRIGSARNANSRLAQKEEDVVLLSPIDVARLAVEDSLEVVIWGKDSTSYEALYTQAKQVGEAPRDFKGMRFVHPGWNTRGTRIGKVILAALWGLDPEKDFQVTTAPWRIGPEKLLGKEADVTLNAMPFVLKNLQAKKFRMVGKSFATAWAETRGKGRRLGGLFWAAWQAWLNQNLKPARALLGAWAEGMTYARRNTGPWAEKYLPAASRETSKEEIRYFARWFQEERPVYPTPYLSQADIEDETAFLKLAVKQKMVRAMPKKPIWQIVRPR